MNDDKTTIQKMQPVWQTIPTNPVVIHPPLYNQPRSFPIWWRRQDHTTLLKIKGRRRLTKLLPCAMLARGKEPEHPVYMCYIVCKEGIFDAQRWVVRLNDHRITMTNAWCLTFAFSFVLLCYVEGGGIYHTKVSDVTKLLHDHRNLCMTSHLFCFLWYYLLDYSFRSGKSAAQNHRGDSIVIDCNRYDTNQLTNPLMSHMAENPLLYHIYDVLTRGVPHMLRGHAFWGFDTQD